MKTADFWSSPSAFYSIMDDTDDRIDHAKHFESFKAQALSKLLASDYKPVDASDVIKEQHHLSPSQKHLLATVLSRKIRSLSQLPCPC